MTSHSAVEKTMCNLGIIPQTQLPVATNCQQAQLPIVARNQQSLTNFQQGSTNFQLGQQPVSSSQILVTSSQNPVALSGQACQAKQDLEVLVATGKTKDFLNKQLTQQELDCMSERDLLKYYKIYQTNLALRVNETFSKMAVRGYTKLVGWLLPVKDTEKLYTDLRSDYILMNEIDRWTGWLSLKMGSLMAVASTTLITAGNIDFSSKINGTESDGGNHSTNLITKTSE